MVGTSAAARNLRAAEVMEEAALRSSAVLARLRVAERTVATRPPATDGRATAAPVVRERAGATTPTRGRDAEEARTAFIEWDLLPARAIRCVRAMGLLRGGELALRSRRHKKETKSEGREGLVRSRCTFFFFGLEESRCMSRLHTQMPPTFILANEYNSTSSDRPCCIQQRALSSSVLTGFDTGQIRTASDLKPF